MLGGLDTAQGCFDVSEHRFWVVFTMDGSFGLRVAVVVVGDTTVTSCDLSCSALGLEVS